MSTNSEPRFPRLVLEVSAEEVDVAIGTLFSLEATGVEERDQTTLDRSSGGSVMLLASFATEQDAEMAREALGERYRPRRDDVVGDAWRESWREHFRPFHLTPRIVVRPSWAPYDRADDEMVLELDPGRSFGTGLHATTRLVANAIEAKSELLRGVCVLDVGCGTGILALCVLMHGAQRVRALDNDPDAVASTIENAERNGFVGRVQADASELSAIGESFPWVVANIEARVLIPMAKALSARVAPGGVLVLSGVLRDQSDDVVKAYDSFEVVQITQDGDWVAIELRAPA